MGQKKLDSSSSTEGSGDPQEIKLKKNLGLHNGVAIIVGIMVGSGIFISPKGVLKEVGSVGSSLLIWGLCGVISLIGAMCYAELGSSIPKSGGDYAYIGEAFGPLPSFLFLWVAQMVIVPTGNAITALTFAANIVQPLYPTCHPPDVAIRLLAALAIALLTFVNCVNVKWAARVQDIFTCAKVLALVIIIICGFVQIAYGRTQNFEEPFKDSSMDAGAYAVAFYSGLFSYAGWNYLNFIVEELKNPYKNLPRAIGISIPLVTVIYVLANVAYFTVLTPRELLDSNAVAVTFADRVLGVMAWSMPLLVAASTFGGLNGAIFTSARLNFVAARQGHFPSVLALINTSMFTPITSLLFGCVMSCVMLCSSDVLRLITYASFVESSFIGISVAGLLYLRYKRPNMYRPIKVHIGFPIFFVLISGFLVIFPLYYSPFECLMGVVMVATGIPVYWLGVSWKRKPMCFEKLSARFTKTTQKVLMCVPEDKDLTIPD